MNQALRRHFTTAEFLDWERRQEFRYEFDGTKVVAMTGGTIAHAIVQRNLTLALGNRLNGKPCQFLGSDVKIEVSGRIRYPDGFVVCTPVNVLDRVVRDPVVIFEVLSDSTEHTDLFDKNAEYAATPSVQRYVLLSQSKMTGTMFERSGGDWIGRLLAADAVLRMPEIGIEVPLAEFYEGLDFTAEDDTTSAPSP